MLERIEDVENLEMFEEMRKKSPQFQEAQQFHELMSFPWKRESRDAMKPYYLLVSKCG